MYVDIDGQTVTFLANTTLTVDQIYGLLELLEVDVDEDGPCHLDICQDCREKDGWVYPRALHYVKSDTSHKIYRVAEMEDNTWACSCPDFIYRKAETGERCKHIHRIILFGS